MKKEKRSVYLELSKLIGASLCLFCRYGNAEGFSSICSSADEGYYVCENPIENLSYVGKNEQDCLPGDDCWGFKPELNVDMMADLTGAILANDWEDWDYARHGKGFTIHGKRYEGEEEKFYTYKVVV